MQSLSSSIAEPDHEPVATLTAPVGKPTQEAEQALEKIFSVGTPDSYVVAAIRTVNVFLPDASHLVYLGRHGRNHLACGPVNFGALASELQAQPALRATVLVTRKRPLSDCRSDPSQV
jgi:hypothetical protein